VDLISVGNGQCFMSRLSECDDAIRRAASGSRARLEIEGSVSLHFI
jgi:hypothetical protein